MLSRPTQVLTLSVGLGLSSAAAIGNVVFARVAFLVRFVVKLNLLTGKSVLTIVKRA